MTDKELSKGLWQIANLVTGFAVFHTIAFSYACARPDFSNGINTPIIKIFIAIVVAFITIFECISVWWCVDKSLDLLKEEEGSNGPRYFAISRIHTVTRDLTGTLAG